MRERVTANRWLSAGKLLACALAAAAGLAGGSAWGAIYSCVDAHGKRLTSDRPIPECTGREPPERLLPAAR